MIECQKCGNWISPVDINAEVIIYHKSCWVEFQKELIAAARGKQWRKLEGSESTEYYEED